MAAVTDAGIAARVRDERGFSLAEVIIATGILTVALLPLAALFTTGVRRMVESTPQLMAREKAREAVESVHAARDTGEASWATIRNVSDGGVFLDGPQPIRQPGLDGLVNTADDGTAELPAALYTREIDINPVPNDGGVGFNPNLRELRVIVRYRVAGQLRTYTMITYVSSYS